MKQFDQARYNENGDDASYSEFKTSRMNLLTWRFLVILCWAFLLIFLPVMIFAEGMGLNFLQDWLIHHGVFVSLGILLLASYANFFLFNFTFKVGNGRVIVYRFGFKEKKRIGEFLSLDYSFQFETVRNKTTGYFFVKSKDRKKRRNKSYPTGLSKFDIQRMSFELSRL